MPHTWREAGAVSTVAPVVIVGGGTAGSIVARTLASMTDLPLVVIEPGGLTDDDQPRFMDGLVGDAVVDVHGMPQARAMGGGSAVNGMVLSGGEPRWLEGLTSVPKPGDVGHVGARLISAGGRVSRLWWNNGRWNPARAMLHVEEEGRLRLVRADAVRIVHDGASATAVECVPGVIGASHVVMCAGAIATPRLLRASGITGEVGRGLQNHPTVSFTFERHAPVTGTFDAAAVLDIVDGDAIGLMVAFERESAAAHHRALVTVSLMNPESRGTVDIDHVDFALLSTERDRAAMGRLVERARRVMADMGVSDHVESGVHPVSHPASSCWRAVDHRGRLHGWTNITVADASVLAHVPHETPAASVTIEALRIAQALGEDLS